MGERLLVGSDPVPRSFFARPTERVARELLGRVLVSRIGGGITAGRIVETEAYLGPEDPGSHAATKRVTSRNEVMYGPPGVAYVYFTYGVHHCLNLIAEEEGTAGGVLIRAIHPLVGEDVMRERRDGRGGRELTSGPGKVAQALGVRLEHDRSALGEGPLEVRDDGTRPDAVSVGPRVGLSEGHDLHLRFFVEGDPYVSRARPGPSRR